MLKLEVTVMRMRAIGILSRLKTPGKIGQWLTVPKRYTKNGKKMTAPVVSEAVEGEVLNENC